MEAAVFLAAFIYLELFISGIAPTITNRRTSELMRKPPIYGNDYLPTYKLSYACAV